MTYEDSMYRMGRKAGMTDEAIGTLIAKHNAGPPERLGTCEAFPMPHARGKCDRPSTWEPLDVYYTDCECHR